jgi:hypothetical protein
MKRGNIVEYILGLENGTHVVEELSDGSKITITKPGKLGANDIRVDVIGPDGTNVTPPHIEIFEAFEQGDASYRATLFNVATGAEPEGHISENAERIFKSTKWIYAQEDVNHPPPRRMGRGFAVAGLRLIDAGFTSGEVADILLGNSSNSDLKERMAETLEDLGYNSDQIRKLTKSRRRFKTRGQ